MHTRAQGDPPQSVARRERGGGDVRRAVPAQYVGLRADRREHGGAAPPAAAGAVRRPVAVLAIHLVVVGPRRRRFRSLRDLRRLPHARVEGVLVRRALRRHGPRRELHGQHHRGAADDPHGAHQTAHRPQAPLAAAHAGRGGTAATPARGGGRARRPGVATAEAPHAQGGEAPCERRRVGDGALLAREPQRRGRLPAGRPAVGRWRRRGHPRVSPGRLGSPA
mmetsp:Transcript_21920/g.68029  ORF Transcript_21920/g.68029 Transcript_21920/m.68029 type:complete len:222 (+) Transcript_21920:1325-1990(+)